jgi:RNA polymerase sigma-70 factor (ECF subfamily)
LRRSIDALGPRLRRFGTALTGSAAEAETLLQRARARALARPEEMQRQLHLATWMFGLMHDAWNEMLGRGPDRLRAGLEAAAGAAGGPVGAALDGAPDLDIVRRALAELPPEHRALLTLVCVEGLSYERAAAVLAVPVGTLMSQLARARLDLHARIVARSAESAALPDGLDRKPDRGPNAAEEATP